MVRASLVLALVLLAAGAVVLSLQSADAHYSVPRYDGAAWGQRCLVPNPRMTPPTCCDHSRATCTAACELADADNGWKNTCRANCDGAGAACHQRIQPRPPVGRVPGTKPPATRD